MAIKKIDLKAEHKYVSLADDAIDAKKSDLKAYEADRDLKHLSYKEGVNPTYFILKNLSSRQYAALLSKYMEFDFNSNDLRNKKDANALDMVFEIFDLACKEVEEDGKRSPINSDQLEMNVLQEVSNAVMASAQMSVTEKK